MGAWAATTCNNNPACRAPCNRSCSTPRRPTLCLIQSRRQVRRRHSRHMVITNPATWIPTRSSSPTSPTRTGPLAWICRATTTSFSLGPTLMARKTTVPLPTVRCRSTRPWKTPTWMPTAASSGSITCRISSTRPPRGSRLDPHARRLPSGQPRWCPHRKIGIPAVVLAALMALLPLSAKSGIAVTTRAAKRYPARARRRTRQPSHTSRCISVQYLHQTRRRNQGLARQDLLARPALEAPNRTIRLACPPLAPTALPRRHPSGDATLKGNRCATLVGCF